MVDTLVIDTGGTFAMEENELGALVVASEYKINQRLSDLFKSTSTSNSFKYTPLPQDQRIDSSGAKPADWKRLADMIYAERENYQAFLVIHGTDTLAYTGAALSFLLHRFPKRVIVTGSQVPLLEQHTDATNNFIGALMFAQHPQTPSGVFVYFCNKLMRGACVMKVDAERWDAFCSPRMPNVGEIKGGKPCVNREVADALAKLTTPACQPPGPVPDVDQCPLVLVLYPGIDQCHYTFSAPAILIVAHGTGNGPQSLKPHIVNCLDKGVLVAVTTECLHGETNGAYDACVATWDQRIAPCRSMSIPAAYAKLIVYLGFASDSGEDNHKQFKQWMNSSRSGEMNTYPDPEVEILTRPDSKPNIPP
eukprot:m.229666 g.229666  ORF g.229666 m.229666 type:complete len:364 (-) comp17344_c0_seq4:1521-2612(-)